jgi:hypothetical protein
MREYDINWVTRKGYKHNQYGKVWFMTARARNITEATLLFHKWWNDTHDYHAFHVEVRPKGKYQFWHPQSADYVHLDEILIAE